MVKAWRSFTNIGKARIDVKEGDAECLVEAIFWKGIFREVLLEPGQTINAKH